MDGNTKVTRTKLYLVTGSNIRLLSPQKYFQQKTIVGVLSVAINLDIQERVDSYIPVGQLSWSAGG